MVKDPFVYRAGFTIAFVDRERPTLVFSRGDIDESDELKARGGAPMGFSVELKFARVDEGDDAMRAAAERVVAKSPFKQYDDVLRPSAAAWARIEARSPQSGAGRGRPSGGFAAQAKLDAAEMETKKEKEKAAKAVQASSADLLEMSAPPPVHVAELAPSDDLLSVGGVDASPPPPPLATDLLSSGDGDSDLLGMASPAPVPATTAPDDDLLGMMSAALAPASPPATVSPPPAAAASPPLAAGGGELAAALGFGGGFGGGGGGGGGGDDDDDDDGLAELEALAGMSLGQEGMGGDDDEMDLSTLDLDGALDELDGYLDNL